MARSSSLKINFLRFFIRAARWRIFRPGVIFFFKHMDRFLPVDRIYENAHWLVFEHPQPEYPLHLLLLPKQPIQSLLDAPLETPEVYRDLLGAVQVLIQRYDLNTCGYRLITNGGPNQSIPQWHWHLISETAGDMHD